MGLVGHGSNREFAAQMTRVADRIGRLRGGDGRARANLDRRRRRPGVVGAAIVAVLASAGELRASDVHASVQAIVGEQIPASSVKNWLARSARGEDAAVERTRRGLYRLRT
jgi:hypothetical protein